MATKAKGSVRDQLLGGHRFKREAVEIEGVDAKLYVRELSAAQMQTLSVSPEEAQAEGFQVVARFIVAALVDEDGDAVFKQGDEASILEAFSIAQVAAIQKQILTLNNAGEVLGQLKNA